MGRKSILNDNYLEDIVYMYYELKLSTVDISLKYNCSYQTIGRFLNKNGYELRSVDDSLKLNNVKEKISKTSSERWNNEVYKNNQIEKRSGKPSGAKGKTWKVTTVRTYDITKDKNPNWKGGITKLSFAIRNTTKYKEWRASVFKRDNYTCQFCGRIRKIGDRVMLECHHIKPFSLILSEHNVLNMREALDCNELFDMNNGQTLCKECHKNTESYGVNARYIKIS